ncbi:hypothetical protein BCR33DRAFT_378222 [Rhizoclosmatium globosum]|uniref:C2H2-type domain-containing protein n=1 Tax=Rhizoclosmatium globosum TaxID=329046 RepID=A0A1Y2BYR1_9FUNG|nr:hypothetical protein BCR33DRAFT_378222 [Rhizoclosmatium globosum]|eukprot:ORY39913.1 hypothetical protein BCR33DRAFT_378222 [Rhizoclosmatium globosum]
MTSLHHKSFRQCEKKFARLSKLSKHFKHSSNTVSPSYFHSDPGNSCSIYYWDKSHTQMNLCDVGQRLTRSKLKELKGLDSEAAKQSTSSTSNLFNSTAPAPVNSNSFKLPAATKRGKLQSTALHSSNASNASVVWLRQQLKAKLYIWACPFKTPANNKPHACRWINSQGVPCPVTHGLVNDIKQHYYLVHIRILLKDYYPDVIQTCPVCSESFQSVDAVQRHWLNEHVDKALGGFDWDGKPLEANIQAFPQSFDECISVLNVLIERKVTLKSDFGSRELISKLGNGTDSGFKIAVDNIQLEPKSVLIPHAKHGHDTEFWARAAARLREERKLVDEWEGWVEDDGLIREGKYWGKRGRQLMSTPKSLKSVIGGVEEKTNPQAVCVRAIVVSHRYPLFKNWSYRPLSASEIKLRDLGSMAMALNASSNSEEERSPAETIFCAKDLTKRLIEGNQALVIDEELVEEGEVVWKVLRRHMGKTVNAFSG